MSEIKAFSPKRFDYVPVDKSRRKVPKRVILSRDFYICQCWCTFDEESEVHHIHPLCWGGEDEPNNMITLCSLCHRFAPDDSDEFLEYQKSGGAGYWEGLDQTIQKFAVLFPEMTIAEFNCRRANLLPDTYEVALRQYREWAAFNEFTKKREKDERKAKSNSGC